MDDVPRWGGALRWEGVRVGMGMGRGGDWEGREEDVGVCKDGEDGIADSKRSMCVMKAV